MSALSGISLWAFFHTGKRPHLIQLLGGTVAAICVTCVKQLLYIFMIEIAAFRLNIRCVGTSNPRSFIPIKPEPFHRIVDALHRFVGGSGLIGIVNPKDECSAMMPCEKPIKQCCTCASDMQKSCRRGREANSNGLVLCHCNIYSLCIGLSYAFDTSCCSYETQV